MMSISLEHADRLNIAIKAMEYVIQHKFSFDATKYDTTSDPSRTSGDLSTWMSRYNGPSIGSVGFYHSTDFSGPFLTFDDRISGHLYTGDDAFAAFMGMNMPCTKWLLWPFYYTKNGIPGLSNRVTAHMVLRRLEWLKEHPEARREGWDYFFQRLDIGVLD